MTQDKHAQVLYKVMDLSKHWRVEEWKLEDMEEGPAKDRLKAYIDIQQKRCEDIFKYITDTIMDNNGISILFDKIEFLDKMIAEYKEKIEADYDISEDDYEYYERVINDLVAYKKEIIPEVKN